MSATFSLKSFQLAASLLQLDFVLVRMELI